MNVPRWVINRCEDRELIPWWAWVFWPTLHACDEWDGMTIAKGHPEYDSCTCGMGGEPFNVREFRRHIVGTKWNHVHPRLHRAVAYLNKLEAKP